MRQRPFLWVTSLAGHQRGVGDAAPYTQPCGSCRGERCSLAGFCDCRQIARANTVRPYTLFPLYIAIITIFRANCRGRRPRRPRRSCVIAKLWFPVGADSISARTILCNHPLARRGQNPSLQTCINAIQQGKCQPPKKIPHKTKKRNLRIQVTLQAQNSLFSLDSAGGANALASTAIDAGSCIDNSLVLHADCTNGAGVNTCTASNALAGNGMSHRELLISVLNGIVPLPALHGCSPVWHTAGLLCLLRYT